MARIGKKRIWITGASSGIGEALAYALSEKECRLVISARNEDALNRVKARCSNPSDVRVLPLDLGDFDSMAAKARTAAGFFGGIDLLINNAGISQRSLIVETDFEVFRKLIDINYLGTLVLTKAVLPYFIQQQKGHFVTVTSLMGKFGSPYRSGYCGAKHALHGFFDVLRMEHEKDGIDVSLICPGFVRTDVAKNALVGDGSAQGREDEATKNGMPVATMASKAIRAIEKRKFEVYIGGKETWGVYLKRLMPRLLYKVVLKSRVT
ncbi:SDR family oxidoreductase [Pseudozobellia thermophila]|uniref:Short-chain dehydrogenase n=1 Tax=Pseudozobellia thermophila TaxID=192903 RepID=A0A1M6LD09_9FLAO|nr:SDR family oxidoreductase [Pseudozobellia thermophila]SHJ69052.1 Short-chain dehydrogenase [Pseudozobellia thermophila]